MDPARERVGLNYQPWVSVFNLCNAVVGAGVLSFPFAFRLSFLKTIPFLVRWWRLRHWTGTKFVVIMKLRFEALNFESRDIYDMSSVSFVAWYNPLFMVHQTPNIFCSDSTVISLWVIWSLSLLVIRQTGIYGGLFYTGLIWLIEVGALCILIRAAEINQSRSYQVCRFLYWGPRPRCWLWKARRICVLGLQQQHYRVSLLVLSE